MTLVEILVVLVVIGLLISVVGLAVGALTKAKLKSAANQLAGAIRYMYDEAATKGHAARLVLDLDERSYRAEVASNRFLLKIKKEPPGRLEERQEWDERARLKGRGRGGIAGADLPRLPPPSFMTFAPTLLKPRTLPGSVEFHLVYTPHQEEPVSEGTAEIYFFPMGYTERALVVLADGETYYSILVDPVSGRARVLDYLYELPANLQEFDEEGG